MAGRGGCFCFGLCHPISQAGQRGLRVGGRVGPTCRGMRSRASLERMGDELSIADLSKERAGHRMEETKRQRETETETN